MASCQFSCGREERNSRDTYWDYFYCLFIVYLIIATYSSWPIQLGMISKQSVARTWKETVVVFFFGGGGRAQQPPVGHGLLIHEVSRSHTTTHHSRQDSSGRVISSSQRPLPNDTDTYNRHPCLRWDSNPQSQQMSGHRPKPQTARPLGPAVV